MQNAKTENLVGCGFETRPLGRMAKINGNGKDKRRMTKTDEQKMANKKQTTNSIACEKAVWRDE
ncbi:MAG: hypothetical protein LBV16_05515 [Elusimicrobiota bacterium]|jgi:hypothetical protein|nr:hypothetical protein [Elusimicrobiota bacterium]